MVLNTVKLSIVKDPIYEDNLDLEGLRVTEEQRSTGILVDESLSIGKL